MIPTTKGAVHCRPIAASYLMSSRDRLRHGTLQICRARSYAERRVPSSRLYQTVLDAQEEAIAQIRDGADGMKIHRGICERFEKAGYKTGLVNGRMQGYFHGTGHGVGLDIHEAPRISRTGSLLLEGHVVTVEPGLYYPGLGAVRIEDMVLVTGDGVQEPYEFLEGVRTPLAGRSCPPPAFSRCAGSASPLSSPMSYAFRFLDDIAIADIAFEAEGDSAEGTLCRSDKGVARSPGDPVTIADTWQRQVLKREGNLDDLLIEWLSGDSLLERCGRRRVPGRTAHPSWRERRLDDEGDADRRSC